MVPRLRGRVEEGRVLLGAGEHDVLERRGFERGVLNERTRFGHICGLVVSVVGSQRAARKMRLEGVERVGQWRQRDAHRSSK